MHCFLESVNTCYCPIFACMICLCCNLNRFVLYIATDKLYIPWFHVVPSVDGWNMHKEAKYNWVKLQNEFQRDVPIFCFNDIITFKHTLLCVCVGGWGL